MAEELSLLLLLNNNSWTKWQIKPRRVWRHGV